MQYNAEIVQYLSQQLAWLLPDQSLKAIATGDEGFHESLNYLIEELSKVQEAFRDGYLSAFPKEHFVRLQSLQAVWAPFYVVIAYTLS